MAKDSRFKKSYRKNASKLHKTIGRILRTSKSFKNYSIYQEYPVNRINSNFKSGREKFDWIIKDLKIIIECHGQQHYFPVNFGGISDEEAISKFRKQQYQDRIKKKAAEQAGWTYIVVKYDEKITVALLLSKIENYIKTYDTLEERDVKKKNTTTHKEALEKAREYRKKRYRESKRWKDVNKKRS